MKFSMNIYKQYVINTVELGKVTPKGGRHSDAQQKPSRFFQILAPNLPDAHF